MITIYSSLFNEPYGPHLTIAISNGGLAITKQNSHTISHFTTKFHSNNNSCPNCRSKPRPSYIQFLFKATQVAMTKPCIVSHQASGTIFITLL